MTTANFQAGTNSGPRLSVIIVSLQPDATLRQALDALRAQTALDECEVLLVTTAQGRAVLTTADLAGFAWAELIEVDNLQSIAEARAIAIRRAAAPLVVLSEDHVYPETGWAEALIAAHN